MNDYVSILMANILLKIELISRDVGFFCKKCCFGVKKC